MKIRLFLKTLSASCTLAAALAVTSFAQPLPSTGPAAVTPENKPAPRNVGGIEPKDAKEAKDVGTVSGVVRFKGEEPEVKPIAEIAGNAFCKNCYKEGQLPPHDEIVIGKSGNDDTVENVLVYVSKGLEGKEFDAPKEPVVLDQVGCVYAPHVVAVMTGQPLEIRNSDATLHNVMAKSRQNTPFNIGMPGQCPPMIKKFKQPEFKINLQCFMHPWMSAWLHVLDHPFFAVTGPDGSFTIKGLPPGEYEITVLHESSQLQPDPATATVKVAAGETKKVDFTYQVKGAKK